MSCLLFKMNLLGAWFPLFCCVSLVNELVGSSAISRRNREKERYLDCLADSYIEPIIFAVRCCHCCF